MRLTSPLIHTMPQIAFDQEIDDGRIELSDVPITFPAYRAGRDEPSLHLNDTLYRNHALYHSEHGECPDTEILTSWAYRGLQGMRSFGYFNRYDIERVFAPSIVRRFEKDLDKIHRKADRLERKRKQGREKASQTNDRRYRRRIAQTLMRLRQGLSQSQIAKALGLSVRTIKRHVQALRESGKSWEKQAVSAGDMSISPPHVTSHHRVDLEIEKTPRQGVKHWIRLDSMNMLIKGPLCKAWDWWFESLHPDDRAEATAIRESAMEELADKERIEREYAENQRRYANSRLVGMPLDLQSIYGV